MGKGLGKATGVTGTTALGLRRPGKETLEKQRGQLWGKVNLNNRTQPHREGEPGTWSPGLLSSHP